MTIAHSNNPVQQAAMLASLGEIFVGMNPQESYELYRKLSLMDKETLLIDADITHESCGLSVGDGIETVDDLLDLIECHACVGGMAIQYFLMYSKGEKPHLEEVDDVKLLDELYKPAA